MKGLIIKDILNLKRQGRTVLLLLAFYIFYSVMMKNPAMLAIMTSVFSMMLPLTSISYDEYGKWDKYALSMPLRRSTVVISKYLLALAIAVAGFIGLTPVSVIIAKRNGGITAGMSVLIMAASVLLSMLVVSVMLPIVFKLGVEKARLIQMLIVFVPTLLAVFLPEMSVKAPSDGLIKLLCVIVPIGIVGLFVLSVFLSVRIYAKKEF